MKRFSALSLVVVLTAVFFATLAIAYPKGDKNGLTNAVAENVDAHVVVEGTVYDYGNSFVYTISNGNRFDPVHLDVYFKFIASNGQEIGNIMRHWWCRASLGGHANRCDCRFSDLGTGYYSDAAIIKMEAHPMYRPEYKYKSSC
jgi:hypothetical protein